MQSEAEAALDALDAVDYLDIGCGDGRSTISIARKLEITGKSLGIDKMQARLPTDTDLPDISFVALDASQLPNRKLVKCATLFNVLPGLAGTSAALDVLRKACIVSRDFVYVSQVNFDPGPYLLRKGFKTFYSDQASSRFQATSPEYLRMARQLMDEGLCADFALMESERIPDSSDSVIHPLQSPPDAGPYDPGLHRFKAEGVPFREPLYKQLHILFCRKPAQLGLIARRLKAVNSQDNILFSTMAL